MFVTRVMTRLLRCFRARCVEGGRECVCVCVCVCVRVCVCGCSLSLAACLALCRQQQLCLLDRQLHVLDRGVLLLLLLLLLLLSNKRPFLEFSQRLSAWSIRKIFATKGLRQSSSSP